MLEGGCEAGLPGVIFAGAGEAGGADFFTLLREGEIVPDFVDEVVGVVVGDDFVFEVEEFGEFGDVFDEVESAGHGDFKIAEADLEGFLCIKVGVAAGGEAEVYFGARVH